MSLGAIFDALNAQLHDGTVDLAVAAIAPPPPAPDPLAPLRDELVALQIGAHYVLTGALLTQTASEVRLVGVGAFGLHGAGGLAALVTLVASEEAGTIRFELQIAFSTSNWTLGQLFPDLPDYDAVDATTAVLTSEPSFLSALVFTEPKLSASSTGGAVALTLAGRLSPQGIVADYSYLLNGWPLAFSGPVELPSVPGGYPSLAITAVDSSKFIPFGSTRLTDIGFRLRVQRDLDPIVNLADGVSALELIGSLEFPNAPGPIVMWLPLASADRLWRLMISLPDGWATIGNALSELAGLLGLDPNQLILPPGFDVLDHFYLSEIEVGLQAFDGPLPELAGGLQAVPSVNSLAVTIGSDIRWQAPIPQVTIDNVGMRWIYVDVGGSSQISGALHGGIVIGDPGDLPSREFLLSFDDDPLPTPVNAFALDVTAYVPNFVITAQLRDEVALPIDVAFKHFFGTSNPGVDPSLSLVAMFAEADFQSRTFSAMAEVQGNWPSISINQLTLSMTSLRLAVEVTQSSFDASIDGVIELEGASLPGQNPPALSLSASFSHSVGGNDWVFNGGLSPLSALSVNDLVSNLLGITPPQGIPDLVIDAMGFRYSTLSGAYNAYGTVSVTWRPTVLENINIAARASALVNRDSKTAPITGMVSGDFSVNQLNLSASVDIGVANPTYTFKIQFGDPYIELISGWTQTTPKQRLLTAQLGGMTVGGVLEYLVDLAAPTIGYRLDPPWDVLNRIDLSNFELAANLDTSTLSLSYKTTIDLGVIKITSLGVSYQRGQGMSGVNLVLEGSFFGQDYSGPKALAWDVIKDPPPAIPGGGNGVLDIYYVGLGQRVRLTDLKPNSVRQLLDAMEKAMQPVSQEPNAKPAPPPISNGIEFNADSQWLIGLDVTVGGVARLGFIFNDPVLYGLSVALGGPKSGSMSGLNFELLYKKISDNVGMFRIDLTLPVALRTINLGQVSITLGVVVVEIFTNGNFSVDLGFPWKRDFTRSFTLQYLPFIGRGGIYFALLDGTTSTRVPKISNGEFSPVVELGIGLAVGVGTDQVIGPLSIGAYIQVEVVFLGVLGWFNPKNHDQPKAIYFWCQGTAAIVGKVYGTVDFKIISVSITLLVEAEAQVTYEVYRPAVFLLAVRVRAEAKVKILFIRVSFSFSIGLSFSFTVGSIEQTPWIIESDSGTVNARLRGRSLPALARQPGLRALQQQRGHLRALRARGRLLSLTSVANAPYLLDFDPSRIVLPGGKSTLALHALPAFSIDAIPFAWNGDAPANAAPEYRCALVLTADDGISPTATCPAERRQRSAALTLQAANDNDLPADRLCQALLRWALLAVTEPAAGPAPTLITAGQLQLLAEQLQRSEAAEQSFSFDNLQKFFGNNLVFEIAGDPGSTPTKGGMLLPIPPVLTLAHGPEGGTPDKSNFAEFNKVGALFEWGVRKYVAEFVPRAPAAGVRPPDDPNAYESLASYLFRDYMLMLTRTLVESAQAQLNKTDTVLDAPASLAEVAARFPHTTLAYVVRPGDTVASAAAALGLGVVELEALNPTFAEQLAAAAPGSEISVLLGVAPALLALDNPHASLEAGVFALGSVPASIRAGDTLDAIATRFTVSAGASGLLDGATLDAAILQAGARLITPAFSYAPSMAMTPLTVAARFFARFALPRIAEQPWFSQTIANWNAALLRGIDGNAELPAGTQLRVPSRFNDSDPASGVSYSSVAGDSLLRIGSQLALALCHPTGDSVDGWAAFLAGVSGSGMAFQVAASELAIQSGETLAELARRTLRCDASGVPDAKALAVWVGAATLLQPLAVLNVSDAQVDTQKYATFAAMSDAFDLPLLAVGGALAQASGLLAAQTLQIAQLPVQLIDTLANATIDADLANIVGRASRQLLSGLRIPAPVEVGGHKEASGPLTSILSLSGQQFPSPAPSDQPNAPGLAMTLTVNADAGFVTLVSSGTTGSGSRVDLIRNPGFGAQRMTGLVYFSEPVSELTFSYSAADLGKRYPAHSFALAPIQPPEALPLASFSPARFGLDHEIALQTPTPLAIPGSSDSPNAAPSAWRFPESLRALALAPGDDLFEIEQSAPRGSASDEPVILSASTFAALCSFQLRRTAAATTYELIGASGDDRQVLLDLYRSLGVNDDGAATAYLLLAPSVQAADSSGLTVLVPKTTFLLRTNLSVATVPESVAAPALRAEDTQPIVDGATLAQAVRFALLLWQGSTVGGSGYYLQYVGADGASLPASAFDQDGTAQLSLLVLARSQQQPAPGGRALLPFNNCALIGSAVDASAQSLSVVDSNDALGHHVANVAPGHIGYRFELPNASADAAQVDADDPPNVFELFNLNVWRLDPAQNPRFVSGQPAPGLQPLEQNQPTWKRARAHSRLRAQGRRPVLDEPPAGPWYFAQVLPIYRFAPPSLAAGGPGLPPPENDPYRGIGGAGALPSAAISLSFADVLGNATQETTPAGLGQVAVGYTDALRAPLTWPGTRIGYRLTGDSSAPSLAIEIRAQAAAVQGSLAQAEAQTLAGARTQVNDLDEVHYQLAQPALDVLGYSTLAASNGIPLEGAGATLWQYAAGLRIYSAAAASLRAVRPAAAAALGLDQLASQYGVSLGAIAAVNGGLDAYALLGAAPVPMPAYLSWAAGDTVKSIIQRAPKGVTVLAATAVLSDARNAVALPLAVGALLALDPRQLTVPVQTAGARLSDLATQQSTTVGQLLLDNADNSKLFATGAVIALDDASLTIGQTVMVGGTAIVVDSPAHVVAAFASLGEHLSIAELAFAIADQTDLIAAGAPYSNAHYAVPAATAEAPFETLARNGSGETLARLAALNTDTTPLFDAGAMLYIGAWTDAPVLAPDNEATLDQFAAHHGISSALLLAELARSGRTLPAGSVIEVPGLMSLAGNAPSVAGVLDEDLSLRQNLAMYAAAAPAQFVLDNLTMPGQLNSGQDIAVTIQGQTYRTQTVAGDRLIDVLTRLQAQQASISAADLGDAIADQPQLWLAALAQLPPAQLSDQPSSINQAAARYGLAAIDFASANLALEGLIASQIPLTLPTASTSTVSSDSLNAILGRLNAQDPDLTLETLVALIGDLPLLRASAQALLPPRACTLTLPLGNSFKAPAPYFPLSVSLRLQRPAALIDPSFESSGPVALAESALAPINTGQNVFADDQGVLALSADIRARFPSLRLATGSVNGESAQLWLVDFDANGIQSLSIAPDAPGPDGAHWPRSYALRPLYPNLISRPGVALMVVNPDGTLTPAAQTSDFVGVDVELWAQQYLQDMDRVLSPPLATALYQNASAGDAVVRLIAAKRQLVQGISDNGSTRPGSGIAGALWPVLALQQSVAAEALAAARQSVSDALGASLATGYATGALVQYASRVQSAWQGGSPPPPARLYGVASTPEQAGTAPYSVTAAKADLSVAAGQVNFLLTVSDPRQQRNIALDIDYTLTHLECNIRPLAVDPTTTYEASNWLNFAPPLSGAVLPTAVTLALGQPTVPLPLRTYPALPSVRSQTAEQSVRDDGSPPQLADLPLWDYQLTYSHEHAAQDQVIVGIRFNQPITRRNGCLAVAPDLATALAVYVNAAPDLYTLMLPLDEPTASPSQLSIAGTAAASLATLAGNVADAWTQHFVGMNLPATVQDQLPAVWLSARVEYDQGQIVAVELTRIADPSTPDAAPGPAGPNGQWPDLVLTAASGEVYKLGSGTGSDLTRRYEVCPRLDPQAWLQLSLSYAHLRIADYQNARAQLSVVRNRDLIDGALTTPSFVFASAPVQAPASATPLNQWTSTVDIGDQGSSPTAALGAAIQALTGGELPVTITVSYGYELTAPSGGASRGLTTYLPVYLVPNQLWSEALASELSQQLQQWIKDYQPNPKGGEWSFGLTAHSTLDATGTLAVLEVGSMRYGL